MTTTTALAADNLPNLTFDQLGVALDIVKRRQAAATTLTACKRADMLNTRVRAEIARRGCVAAEASDGRTMVGYPSHFTPIT